MKTQKTQIHKKRSEQLKDIGSNLKMNSTFKKKTDECRIMISVPKTFDITYKIILFQLQSIYEMFGLFCFWLLLLQLWYQLSRCAYEVFLLFHPLRKSVFISVCDLRFFSFFCYIVTSTHNGYLISSVLLPLCWWSSCDFCRCCCCVSNSNDFLHLDKKTFFSFFFLLLFSWCICARVSFYSLLPLFV